MADWAGLQTDILGVIVKKLAIPDYLRFRAVCTSWNHICRDVYNCPRTDPWLMLPTDLQAHGGSKFFCVPERKNQTIHLPATFTIFGSTWVPVGSSHGWLIFYSPSLGDMKLLNPISGADFNLPKIGCRAFYKAMLLEMNDTSFTVAVILRDQRGYKVTRKGSKSWSSVESKHDLVEILKHNRKIYTMDIYGTVALWAEPPRSWPDEDALQMYGPNHNLVHYSQHGKLNCLVESPAGDLMRVKRQSNDKFVVRMLNKEKFSWEKVDNIGDFSLFVSYYSSVCYRAGDQFNLKANCIYFIDSYSNLCAFNLENGTKELVNGLEAAEAYAYPEPHAVRHRPEGQKYMWLLPSLR
uniref:DUF295 domain-containing protein n=1 Tax=Leersia perrieri TaxID=77586 RepID=A0A0D9UXL7_9ORYZ